MSDQCHFCSRDIGERTYWYVAVGQPTEPAVTQSALLETTQGQIRVCNICYEQEKFDALSPEDIGALHYTFSHPYSEHAEDYLVSLKRLQRAFELCPCPEIEGALGYAYWKVGRTGKAVRHCRSSLSQQSNHFGASKALYVLKQEDSDVEKFVARLRAEGRRIKSLAAEFPGQRIKRPKHKRKV